MKTQSYLKNTDISRTAWINPYIVIQKSENLLNEKNVKITKQTHASKGFASSYNLEILNSFNPEQQLKDTESSGRNKLW